MKRQALAKFIEQECERIKELFSKKNVAYGRAHDAFYNFTEAARRVFYNDPEHDVSFGDMLSVLLIYMHKHLIALENVGVMDPEAQERFRDIAVYALIGVAIIEQYRKICVEWKPNSEPVE